MLVTLYLHARDAESGAPVLGDRFAAGILAQIDYDFDRLKRLHGNQPVIIARAALIDARVAKYLRQTPDAVVLHLGCGLDSRVLRLDPGPGVSWIEVDQRPVNDLRHRFYPARNGVTTIAASVTEHRWWDDLPTGRPTLVIGEGLLMYLPPGGVQAVCDQIMRHDSPATMMVFDTVAPWVQRIARFQPNMRKAPTGFESSTRDLENALRQYRSATWRISTSLAAFITLIDAIPVGHQAMCRQTYISSGSTHGLLT